MGPFAEGPFAFLGSGGGRGDSFGFVLPCFPWLCHAGLVWGLFRSVYAPTATPETSNL